MSEEHVARKRRGSWIWLLVLVAVAVVWFLWKPPADNGRAADAEDALEAQSSGEAVADQILVDLRDDVPDSEVAAIDKQYGLDLKLVSAESHDEQFYRAHVDPAQREAILAALGTDSRVEGAEQDAIYTAIGGAESANVDLAATCRANAEARYANELAEQIQHEGELHEERVRMPSVEAARLDLEAKVAAAAQDCITRSNGIAYRNYPNDPLYKHQWHLAQIGMPQAWPMAETDGVIVAVIDTGVAYEDWKDFHMVPDLAGVKIVKPYDFVGNNVHANDDHGHGTHVAGTIAQATNNGIGVAGVAPGVSIMPLKVLGKNGSGSVAGIADAIRYAADNGAKVINMSLGGRMRSPVLAKAVKYAHDKGVVVVCAAGNDGSDRVSYPAAYPGALAVAATQFDETTTFYSNRGKEIDIAAPGGNTKVDQNNDGMPDGVLQNTIVVGDPTKDGYFPFMGTSMASPHIAGVAALLVGAGVTNPDTVEEIIKSTARAPKGGKVEANRYGAGIVDVPAALKKARAGEGASELGLGVIMAVAVAFAARRKQGAGGGVGLGYGMGVLAGSAGLLFFLPLLGDIGAKLSTLPVLEALTRGLPSAGLGVLGPAAYSNPLTMSALVPLALIGFGLGVKKLRPLLAGLAVGVAAHLVFHAASGIADVRWMALDGLWLAGNAVLLTVVAVLTLRR